MTPLDLGFPESFTSFRPAQEEAIEHVLTSEKRFTGIGAPPGVGKSGIALALAKLLGGRTVILTANKGLEDQYIGSLGSMGLLDMRGRSNFRCWEGGSCEDGARMDCKDKEGCPYICQLRAWNKSEIGVTNYAFWLASPAIQMPDTLILDEAGLAPEWLSRALDFTITERQCHEAKHLLAPIPGDTHAEWFSLVPSLYRAADAHYTKLKYRGLGLRGYSREKLMRDIRHAETFVTNVQKIAQLDDNWVISREEGNDEGRLWRFECVWPGRFRERLFRNIQRVVLMSATLRPKTLGLLGIKHSECDFREWGRQFPAVNGPVVWIPTARMNHRTSEEDNAKWIERIKEICSWGVDRKGLIHTVSYARAKLIADAFGSANKRILVNGAADPESSTSREIYDRFMDSKNSAVLVSPSFSTGWDFPGQAAEWQIISKIAFPDTRSKVMQARCAADRSYSNYLAAQDLVQGCGRIVRSEVDRGVTFIIDDSWAWFGHQAADHMPKWFKVRREDRLPKPLPKI